MQEDGYILPDDELSCQLHAAHMGVSSLKSTPDATHTEQTFDCGEASDSGLRVVAAHQWTSTTRGRIAADSYSWLQAVHWVHGSGLHQPARGPRFSDTTVLIARVCADLTPCRPSVAYLMRITKLSERTVQYHLGILRETGLLAYVVKGGRRKGATPLASEFTRVIPAAFDTALGIRTVGEGTSRRAVGIAEHGRKAIAKLAKLAARKVRKSRPKRPSKAAGRCTPIGGSTSTSSSTGSTYCPSESKLASGKSHPSAPKNAKRGKRKLNQVGRRRQLGSELVRTVGWLHNAAPARISWVARHVADAGWTVEEVTAWLALGEAPQQVRRPSGFLAQRLKDATRIWDTAAKRRNGTEAWRDSRRATQARHVEWEGAWQAPRSQAVQRQVAEAFTQMHAADPTEPVCIINAGDSPIRIEDFTRDEVIDMRAAARKDPGLIHMAIDALGERDARRLYTNDMVDQALNPLTARLTAHARLHA